MHCPVLKAPRESQVPFTTLLHTRTHPFTHPLAPYPALTTAESGTGGQGAPNWAASRRSAARALCKAEKMLQTSPRGEQHTQEITAQSGEGREALVEVLQCKNLWPHLLSVTEGSKSPLLFLLQFFLLPLLLLLLLPMPSSCLLLLFPCSLPGLHLLSQWPWHLEDFPKLL